MKNKRASFEVKALGEKKAEVFIYDIIGADGWGGGLSAKDFAQQLKALGDIEQISIRINSPGGNVFDGVAIYNILDNHPAKVITYIDGMALSAASVIALAGEEVHMAENAFFMIHNPWTMAIGDATELRKDADLLDKIRDSLLNTYVSKSMLDAETIQKMMDAETWFSAQEAFDAGFISHMGESVKIAAQFDPDAIRAFRKVPDALGAVIGQGGTKEKPACNNNNAPAKDEDEHQTWRTELNNKRLALAKSLSQS